MRRRPSSLLLAGVLFLVLAPARRPPRAAEVAPELLGRTLVAVDFEADEPVDDRSLRELVALRPGEPLTLEGLDEAQRRLAWKDVWSTIDSDVVPVDDGVRVVFHLTIKRTVSSVKVSGYEAFYAEDLVRRVRIPMGAPMSASTVEQAAERLREYYRREGFPDVVVTTLETPEAHRQVAIDFHIDEGTPVIVTCVVIEGDVGFPTEDLARSLKVSGGDRRTRTLARDVKRAALGFYRDRNFFDASVNVDWVAEADPKRGALVVTVDPGIKSVIVFDGNQALSRGTLLELIDLSKRTVITDATWREVGRRIAAEYRAHGYYRVSVKLEMEQHADLRTIRYRIVEGERYWIRRVEFVGNEAVSSEALQAVMGTRPAHAIWVPFSRAGTLDDNVLNDDLRRIWFLYRRLGYESAEIVDARSSFDGEAVDVTIEIDEGPRTLVTSVQTEGFAGVEPMPVLAVRPGEVFDPEKRDADVKTLVAAASRDGYPQARVESELVNVRTASEVETTVIYRAERGPHRLIGPVVVQNNLITKDRVIERELPFKEGAPYDPQALVTGQNKVYSLGLFRRVNVQPLEPDVQEGPAPVAVQVDEGPAGSFSYGLGYESDIGFRTFGEVAYDNLQGMNRRLSLRGDFSILPSDVNESQYVLNLGFRTPHVFDSEWTSRSNAILVRNTQTLNRYSIEGFTLATALEREIAPRLVVGGIVELDQADTFDVAADANLAAEGVKDVGFLRQVDFGPYIEWDRRDDPFAPHSGTFETFRFRYAPTALGSDIRFLTLLAKHVQYIPITDDLTFVYALRGAWALAMNGQFTVPIRDRYFIGGRTTVRGFEENSIAPLGSDGDPIGGDIMVNGNAELRFPLLFGFGGAVFFDTGGSFLRNECGNTVCNFSEISLANMRESAGLGLRYLTPVGPISLEYGFKIDRRSGESIGAFHFTIGNIF